MSKPRIRLPHALPITFPTSSTSRAWITRYRSPARALLVTGLLWLTAFFTCRWTLWRDPHSAFFQSETVYELGYSRIRSDQALRFVDKANLTIAPAATGNTTDSQDPLLCVALVTVKRDPIQYLAETVGSILEGLHPDERAALYLYVLFANTDPTIHPEWNATWLNNLADLAEGYDLTDTEMEKVRKAEKERNFYVKGVLYV